MNSNGILEHQAAREMVGGGATEKMILGLGLQRVGGRVSMSLVSYVWWACTYCRLSWHVTPFDMFIAARPFPCVGDSFWVVVQVVSSDWTRAAGSKLSAHELRHAGVHRKHSRSEGMNLLVFPINVPDREQRSAHLGFYQFFYRHIEASIQWADLSLLWRCQFSAMHTEAVLPCSCYNVSYVSLLANQRARKRVQ